MKPPAEWELAINAAFRKIPLDVPEVEVYRFIKNLFIIREYQDKILSLKPAVTKKIETSPLINSKDTVKENG